MLLVWLLAAAQGTAVEPPHDLTSYLAVAARFGSTDHSAAMGEILSWTLPEIGGAAAGLRRQGRRLRAVPEAPGDIAFRTVEAAVLPARGGRFARRCRPRATTSGGCAPPHLGRAPRLVTRGGGRAATHGHAIAERIDRRDFDVALAAASLALGFPATACSFAEEARRRAPLDAEVHLMLGCAAETRARELALRRQDSEAGRRREEAERALRDALALDPGLQEARLRLGQLLVDRGRLVEAESFLDQVELERPTIASATLRGSSSAASPPPGPRRRRGRLLPPALEAWPDSQAARLALAQALERSDRALRRLAARRRRAWPRPAGSTGRGTRGGSIPSARRARPRRASIATLE